MSRFENWSVCLCMCVLCVAWSNSTPPYILMRIRRMEWMDGMCVCVCMCVCARVSLTWRYCTVVRVSLNMHITCTHDRSPFNRLYYTSGGSYRTRCHACRYKLLATLLPILKLNPWVCNINLLWSNEWKVIQKYILWWSVKYIYAYMCSVNCSICRPMECFLSSKHALVR